MTANNCDFTVIRDEQILKLIREVEQLQQQYETQTKLITESAQSLGWDGKGHPVAWMVDEIERLQAELAAIDDAFEPVLDWYNAQGRLDRAAMLRNAVEDLQRDRSEVLKMATQLEHALDAGLQLALERDKANAEIERLRKELDEARYVAKLFRVPLSFLAMSRQTLQELLINHDYPWLKE